MKNALLALTASSTGDEGRVATEYPPGVWGLARVLGRVVQTFTGGRHLQSVKLRKRSSLQPLHRSWRSAWWEARGAVRAGVPLDDFLRYRLAASLASLPVAETELPVELGIQDGKLVQSRRRSARLPVPEDAGRGDPKNTWLRSLVELDGPVAVQDVQAAQADVGRFAAEAEVQAERVEQLARALDDDLGAGKVTGPASVEATPEQMGRPPVPHSRTVVGITLLCLALLVAETWQLTIPYLQAIGIDTRDLVREAAEHSLSVIFGGVFALGASLSLFVFAQVTLERGLELFAGEAESIRRKTWIGGACTGAALLAAITGWALAGMRHAVQQAAPDLGPAWTSGGARTTFFLLVLVVPLSTAYLLRLARQLSRERESALDAALIWDRARYESLAERDRRLELLTWAQEEQERLEETRDAAQRTLRLLNRRGIEAGSLLAEAAALEERELAKVAQSVAAAVELDRYQFLRQAAQREAVDLVSSPHRTAPEPRLRRDPPAPVPSNNLGLAS